MDAIGVVFLSGGKHNVSMREMSAGIIIKDKKVLLVHNMKHGLRVEPPGGKKLSGEGWEESVAREIREELGVEVRVKGLFGEYRTHSPEGDFMVRMYLCDIASGEPRVMEPEKIPSFGWYSLEDLKRLSKEGPLVPNMRLALEDLEELFL
ncbi:MAG: NUDIX hydrolase [Candidatus Methylomirabilis sp.]|nr:NUDIX hydrolase [Deltaproteobacteria bacterium]